MRLRRALAMVLAVTMIAGNYSGAYAMEQTYDSNAMSTVDDVELNTESEDESYSQQETSSVIETVTSETETETEIDETVTESEEVQTETATSSETETETITESLEDMIPVAVPSGRMNVYVGDDDGLSGLITYDSFADVATYIDVINNTSMSYVVTIDGDIDAQNLVFPKNAKEVTYEGMSGSVAAPVTISFSNNVSLGTNITLKDITLNGENSALALNGKSLTIIKERSLDNENKLLSVTGKNGDLIFKSDCGETLNVNVGGNINGLGKLSMTDTSIKCAGNIAVRDIVSDSENNSIEYNAEGTFTITGTVNAENDSENRKKIYAREDVGDTYVYSTEKAFEGDISHGKISEFAINIKRQSAGDIKKTDIVVATGAKVDPATMYVTFDDSGYFMPLKKVATTLVTYDPKNVDDACVVLYCVKNNKAEKIGMFNSLNAAFVEINNRGDSEGEYEIDIWTYLDERLEPLDINVGSKDVLFPTKAKSLKITGISGLDADGTAGDTITIAKNIKIGCNTIFKDIKFAATSGEIAVSLQNYELTLDNVSLNENTSWGKVTGKSTNAESELYLKSGKYLFPKDISVSFLELGEEVEAKCFGKNTFGYILSDGTSDAPLKYPKLGLAATVTKDKNGKISKAVPQSTLVEDLYSDDFDNAFLNVELYDASGKPIAATSDDDIAVGFVPFINAKNANMAGNINANRIVGYVGTVNRPLTKRSGQIGLSTDENFCVYLIYDDFYENSEKVISEFTNIQDAIAEINALAYKRDYTIKLLNNVSSDKGGMEEVVAAPITMPKAAYVKSLTIEGVEDGTGDLEENNSNINTPNNVTVYTTAGITFTCDTVVRNVNFVITDKNKNQPVATKQYAVNTFAISAGTLTLDDVTCNTAVVLDGKKKANIRFEGDFEARPTQTAENNVDVSPVDNSDDFIEVSINGSIQNFVELSIEDIDSGEIGERSRLEVIAYENKSANNFAAPVFNVTTLKAAYTDIYVAESKTAIANGKGKYAANSTISYLDLEDSNLTVNGNLNATNVALTGNTTNIYVDKIFNIKGTLYKNSANVLLFTRVTDDKSGAIPYLNISGYVQNNLPENNTSGKHSDLIKVKVGYPIGTRQNDEYILGVKDNSYKDGKDYTHTTTVLTAKNAVASLFCVDESNTKIVYSDGRVGAPRAIIVNEDLDSMYSNPTNWYYMQKVSNAIRYNAVNKLAVVVTASESEVTKDKLKAIGRENVIGYFPTIADAVKAINSSEQNTFTVTLLHDTPVEKLTLSKKKVFFNSYEYGEVSTRKLNYNSAITLAGDVVFHNVDLCASKANLAINTGVYNVEFVDCKATGKAIGAVTGKNKDNGKVVMSSRELKVGGISKISELQIADTTEVNGAVDVKCVTGTDSDNVKTLRCTQTNKKLTANEIKGAGSEINKRLTIEWCVGLVNITGTGVQNYALENAQINLQLPAKKTVSNYELVSKNGVVAISGKELIKVKGKIDLSSVGINAGGYSVYYPLKAAGAIFNGNKLQSENNNSVNLKVYDDIAVGPIYEMRYLDMGQASTEIETLKMSNAYYVIDMGEATSKDPVVTDSAKYSAIKLPNAKKSRLYSKLYIKGRSDGKTKVASNGNVTAYGDVEFDNINMEGITARGVKTAMNITSAASAKSSDAKITLVNSTALCGKANIPNLVMNSSSEMSTWNTTTLGSLALNGDSHWIAIAAANVKTIESEQKENKGCYIASYEVNNKSLKKNVPTITVTGDVTTPVVVKLVNKAKTTDYTYGINTSASDYRDKPLILGKKANAANVCAAPLSKFDNGKIVLKDNYSSYKDVSGYVYNGDLDEMSVMITQGDMSSGGISKYYAKTLYDAFRSIDNAANTNAVYVVTIRDNAEGVLTEINGKTYRAFYTGADPSKISSLALPTKASQIMIMAESIDEPETPKPVVVYSGKLNIKTRINFGNISFTEAKVKNDEIEYMSSITPVSSMSSIISFKEGFDTCAGKDSAGMDIIKVNGFTAKKGIVALADNMCLTSENGPIDIYGMQFYGDIKIDCNKPITIGEVGIISPNLGSKLDIAYRTTAKEFAKSVTQLNYNGLVTYDKYATINFMPYIWDEETEDYIQPTKSQIEELYCCDDADNLPVYKKIANVRGNMGSSLAITGKDGEYSLPDGYDFFVIDKGLYICKATPVVEVKTATSTTQYNSFEQAVKAIDANNDAQADYTIRLLGNIGENSPSKSLALPKKAHTIIIESGRLDGKKASLFTETTKISTGCDLVLDNVSIQSVKKVDDEYVAVNGTIQTSGKNLAIKGMITSIYYDQDGGAKPGSTYGVVGNGKGVFRMSVDNNSNVHDYINSVKNVKTYTCGVTGDIGGKTIIFKNAEGVSGVGELNLPFGTILNLGDSNLTVKNLNTNANQADAINAMTYVEAANISVSDTARLGKTTLMAGTADAVSRKANGKISLNKLVLTGNSNISEKDNLTVNLLGKQNAKGVSQVEIKNRLSFEHLDALQANASNYTKEIVKVGLYYNNVRTNPGSGMARLYEGMQLIKAPYISAALFAPFYATTNKYGEINSVNMGRRVVKKAYAYDEDTKKWVDTGKTFEPFGFVKNGDYVTYKKLRGIVDGGYDVDVSQYEAELVIGTDNVDDLSSEEFVHEYCITYEDAVARIEKYNDKTQKYVIVLTQDADIATTNSKGAYVVPPMPSKASSVTIYNGMITCKPNITLKCNTKFKNVFIMPNNLTKVSIEVGNFEFTVSGRTNFDTYFDYLNKITSKTKKGTLIVDTPMYLSGITGLKDIVITSGNELIAEGNVSAVNLNLISEGDGGVLFEHRGNATFDQIVLSGKTTCLKRKNIANKLTVNKAVVFGDGTSTDERLRVLLPDKSPVGTLILTSKKASTIANNRIDVAMIANEGVVYDTCVNGNNITLSKVR
ncbi:MAG: hypothetical protein KBT19_04155 [Lachnospiraceae bacterium]|nr:hypothetical protein [Candidatus Colinaster equi]